MSGTHGSHFLGVCPIDQLPSLPLSTSPKTTGFCFIVNTDPSNLPGVHWLAVYIDANKRRPGEVFDSYGRPPPLQLQRWLSKHCREWVYTKRFIQGPLTDLCGVYCIFVLDERCTTGMTFAEIVKMHFGADATKNDAKMQRYLKVITQ